MLTRSGQQRKLFGKESNNENARLVDAKGMLEEMTVRMLTGSGQQRKQTNSEDVLTFLACFTIPLVAASLALSLSAYFPCCPLPVSILAVASLSILHSFSFCATVRVRFNTIHG